MKATRMLKVLMRLRPVLRFIKFRILHVDDSPERIARGLAVGIFIGYLPLMGIQMFLAWIAAAIFRANKVLAILGVWISNPATALIIYYPCYLLGRWVLAFTSHKPDMTPEELEAMFDTTLSFYRFITEFYTITFWKDVLSTMLKIGVETCIGSVILGAIFAAITHRLTYNAVVFHRRRKLQKQTRAGRKPLVG